MVSYWREIIANRNKMSTIFLGGLKIVFSIICEVLGLKYSFYGINQF